MPTPGTAPNIFLGKDIELPQLLLSTIASIIGQLLRGPAPGQALVISFRPALIRSRSCIFFSTSIIFFSACAFIAAHVVSGAAWSSNPLFVQESGEYYWYQNDHLGTPQKIIAENGEIVWSARYDGFGRAIVDVETVVNNLRFPGQYFDGETGLYYNWHRFYDPEIGRYISADPIGLRGGINLYAYVSNDPVNGVDPWGLECVFKSLLEARITGNTETITMLESQHPVDPLVDSLPASGYSYRLEHKFQREEWAQFDVLVEVCTDDCGNFISRTEISADKKKGTEYWVNIHEWQRYRTIMLGIPFPVGPIPAPWEKWRSIY